MTDEPEQDAVLTRLDELVTLLRSVELRLRELVEAQGRADRLGPLVGGGSDIRPLPGLLPGETGLVPANTEVDVAADMYRWLEKGEITGRP